MALHHVTRARAALLLITALLVVGLLSPARAQAPEASNRTAILYLVGGVQFESVMSTPSYRELAAVGSVGLMATAATSVREETDLLTDLLSVAGVRVCEVVGQLPAPPSPCGADSGDQPSSGTFTIIDMRHVAALGTIAENANQWLDSASEDRPSLVLITSPAPSPKMDLIGDEVTPVFLGMGRGPESLGIAASPEVSALTSDSTRQDGLVSNVDVAPTILDFFGIPIPSEMEGNPIRVVDDGDVVGLHRLHLEQRRIRIPIQIGMLVFLLAIVVLTVGASLTARVRGLGPEASAVLRFLVLSVVALYLVTLAGGLLPRLTYAVVIPFVVVATLGLAALAVGARWPGTFGPFMFLAAVGLSFVIVDATFFGGRAFRVPLIGGTMFDGARFYGLPNAFTALVLAAAVLLAVPLEPFAGFALIFTTGLMVGFPRLGADIGGSITLFAASGLWWVLRTRPMVRVREIGIVAGVVALGLAAVLLVNRYWPGTPTHATRFVERSGDSLSSVFSTIRHRFAATFHLMSAQPEAYIPMAGLLFSLWVLVARPEPFRSGLELAGPVWRTALLVIVLASLVAFVANDTGSTAAAPGLIYAVAGLAYPAFLASERRAAPT